MNNTITTSAPARIDLSGGPTDWCGLRALTMAINLRAYASISQLQDKNRIEIKIGNISEKYTEPKYGTNLDLFKAVIELSGLKGFKVTYRTDIPRGSGLGGSAPLTVATLFALNQLYHKNWSFYYIAELAQRAETLKLQTVQGYQDQYTAAFGGLTFQDYTDKGCQKGHYSKPIDQEPYTVVEDLSSYNPDFHIIIVVPPIERTSSNETNSSISERYLAGDSKIVNDMLTKARISQEAKKAVIEGDLAKLYKIINQNNEILDSWGWQSKYNKEIWKLAEEHGALAVKTCGAGRGGMAIFAKDQSHQKKLNEVLEPKADYIFNVKLDQGVRIEK